MDLQAHFNLLMLILQLLYACYVQIWVDVHPLTALLRPSVTCCTHAHVQLSVDVHSLTVLLQPSGTCCCQRRASPSSLQTFKSQLIFTMKLSKQYCMITAACLIPFVYNVCACAWVHAAWSERLNHLLLISDLLPSPKKSLR